MFEERCECGMKIPRGYGFYLYSRVLICKGCGRANRNTPNVQIANKGGDDEPNKGV